MKKNEKSKDKIPNNNKLGLNTKKIPLNRNNYNFKTEVYKNLNHNQYDYDNKNYLKENIYNTLNLNLGEEIDLKASNNFMQKKMPKDTNKIPKDSVKNKKNKSINKDSLEQSKNNKINNITTINKNKINKIKRINIVLEPYNNDITHKNNNKTEIKSIEKIEKQPIDNYKRYLEIMNEKEITKTYNNKNILPSGKYESKNKDKIKICNSKGNKLKISISPKHRKINNENDSISIIYNNTNFRFKNNNNISKINDKPKNNNNKNDAVEMLNKSSKKNISSLKIDKEIYDNNNNLNSRRSINKNKEVSLENIINNKNSSVKNSILINNKMTLNKKTNNNFEKIFPLTKRSNESTKRKKIESIKIEKKNEKGNLKKMIKETKSYIDQNKSSFPERRNTYFKSIKNKNDSLNLNEKSKENKENKEKDRSNFASLINKRKLKMFSSIKNINDFHTLNEMEESNKDLNLNTEIIKSKKTDKNDKLKDKSKTKTIDEKKEQDKEKIKPLKDNIIELDYKKRRLYSPQLSYDDINGKKYNSSSSFKNMVYKNINKSSNNMATFLHKYNHRELSYNKSFEAKKKKLFKKNIEPNTLMKKPIKNKENKLKILDEMEDILISDNKDKDIKNIYLVNTEQNANKYLNPFLFKFMNINNNISEISNNTIPKNKTFNNIFKSLDTQNSKKQLSKKNFEDNYKTIGKTQGSTKNINYKKLNSNKNITKIFKKNAYFDHLSLGRTTSRNKSNQNIYYNFGNQRTTRIIKKKVVYSRYSDKEQFDTFSKKKSLYSFSKKTFRKNSLYKSKINISSEERKELENRGFSSSKKLEQIKKKYKFLPKVKEKKDNLQERNIKYIGSSKGFSNLLNSSNLEDDIIQDEDINNPTNDENKDKNIQDLPNKDKNRKDINNNLNNENKKINDKVNNNTKNENNAEDMNKEKLNDLKNKNINEQKNISIENINDSKKKDDNQDDILNNKSFILDLNNAIPINEKELEMTVNKRTEDMPSKQKK